MNISTSNITKHIIRDNWEITPDEIELDRTTNKPPIMEMQKIFPSIYPEMKNFFLAIIRMKDISEIKQIIQYLISQQDHFMYYSMYREVFVRNVAWAIPSQKAIDQIVEWFWQRHNLNPETKLVDFGCGSGLWCALLNDAGIPKESLIGVDLPNDTKTRYKFNRNFYNITYDANYKVDPNDIFFITWGYLGDGVIDDYISRGGKCIIILGEDSSGCTYPPGDYFINDQRWDVESIRVVGSLSCLGDILSLNIKK